MPACRACTSSTLGTICIYKFPWPADRLCSVCGERRFPHLEGKRRTGSRTLCGRTAIHVHRREVNDAFIDEQAARAGGQIRRRSPAHLEVAYTVDARDFVLTFFRDGRVVVDGTSDEREAKRILAEVIQDIQQPNRPVVAAAATNAATY